MYQTNTATTTTAANCMAICNASKLQFKADRFYCELIIISVHF